MTADENNDTPLFLNQFTRIVCLEEKCQMSTLAIFVRIPCDVPILRENKSQTDCHRLLLKNKGRVSVSLISVHPCSKLVVSMITCVRKISE